MSALTILDLLLFNLHCAHTKGQIQGKHNFHHSVQSTSDANKARES